MPESVVCLGTPVIPFFPLYFGVFLLKLDIKKKGTVITKRLLGNLDVQRFRV